MASWSHHEMLDAELHDTLEHEAMRGRRLHPDEPVRPQEPVSGAPAARAADCPDCGSHAALEPLGFCGVCGLHWDDIVAAAEFYDRAIREALADAALPSPRVASYPRRKIES